MYINPKVSVPSTLLLSVTVIYLDNVTTIPNKHSHFNEVKRHVIKQLLFYI